MQCERLFALPCISATASEKTPKRKRSKIDAIICVWMQLMPQLLTSLSTVNRSWFTHRWTFVAVALFTHQSSRIHSPLPLHSFMNEPRNKSEWTSPFILPMSSLGLLHSIVRLVHSPFLLGMSFSILICPCCFTIHSPNKWIPRLHFYCKWTLHSFL